MTITHAKVSGLTNPADPDLVGGEDWDAEHVVADAPALVGLASITLTTAGAIATQSSRVISFSKTTTGTYRALCDFADFGGVDPSVITAIHTPSGAPRFVRSALGNNGTSDYIEVTTIDSAGAAVDVASGRLEVAAFGMF